MWCVGSAYHYLNLQNPKERKPWLSQTDRFYFLGKWWFEFNWASFYKLVYLTFYKKNHSDVIINIFLHSDFAGYWDIKSEWKVIKLNNISM